MPEGDIYIERKKEISYNERLVKRIGPSMGIGAILEGWGSSEDELITKEELPVEVRAFYHLPNK